ncbi:MAG: serine/threonine protein kinase [Acidobacteria bacterium]|nr:MAG: serine/threonine protein kinase [Acidobacteriota bacterium]
MVDASRWSTIREVLDAAVELEGEARAAYLERACAGDGELHTEIESLLAFDARTETFIDQPIFDVNRPDARLGRRAGPYRIVRLLGRGGMGDVYLAAREDDFTKRVALKLIRRGKASPEVIRRFHEERQILAELEHPSIARLLDGGTDEGGNPYLVMELVEGRRLDRYCDEQRLDVGARLALYRRVCEAVEEAHRHLVVHRDLKPSNILVAADGTPKLLDFGIAKLLDGAAGEAAANGHRGPMSPRYASPEQVRGGRITTASDVYALGVLLYELLAGRDPYDAENLTRPQLVEAIAHDTPPPPSAAAAEAPATACHARATTRRRLRRRLRGDLDAIVMKAIAKSPQQRYGSVAQLIEDLDRHRDAYPVRARRGGLLYRAGRYLRRHHRPLAAGLLLLALAALTLVTRQTQQQAMRERQRAAAVSTIIEDLLWASSPDSTAGAELTVREVLERSEERLTAVDNEPTLQAALTAIIGRVYQKLGQLERAEALLRQALELQRRYDPKDDVNLARRANELAAVLHEEGDRAAAEPLYREALERIGGCSSADPDAFLIANNLASLRAERRDFAEAEALYRCALDLGRRAHGEGYPLLTKPLGGLAGLRYRQGDLAEAESLFRQVLAIRRARYGAGDTSVANALNNLGVVLAERGALEEAAAALREAVEIRARMLSGDHPHLANSRKNLARVLTELGAAEEAESLARQALDALHRRTPDDRGAIADAESVVGGALVALGRYGEAERLLLASYPVLVAARGGDSSYARAARARLVELYERWGRPQDAAPYRATPPG